MAAKEYKEWRATPVGRDGLLRLCTNSLSGIYVEIALTPENARKLAEAILVNCP